MRIMTILLITLFTGLAGIGVWIMMGPELPSVFPSDDAGQEKTRRKQAKWREAPYVFLAPSETLPEEKASLPSPPPAPSRLEAAPAAPSPPSVKSSIAQQVLETVIGPQAAPRPVAKAELQPATQADAKPLPQAAPRPMAKAEPQPATQTVAKPLPQAAPQQLAKTVAPSPSPPETSAAQVLVTQETAEEKMKLQLLYEAKTNSQAEALQKKQSLLAKGTVRFRRAVPLSSGALKSGKMTIKLAGLDALAGDAQCKYASGKSWACGRWGRYSLRRLIRRRAVVCDRIEEISQTEVSGFCKVVGVDINKWVVRRGWGQPAGEATIKYADALKAAKNDKLGQWSDEPIAKQD